MVAFGGKLLLAMYGSHSGASRLSAVWKLSAFWRVCYRRFHCIMLPGPCPVLCMIHERHAILTAVLHSRLAVQLQLAT